LQKDCDEYKTRMNEPAFRNSYHDGYVQNSDGTWSKPKNLTSTERTIGTMAESKQSRIKQSHKVATKLHRDWGLYLKSLSRSKSESVYEESITLSLCNGVRYRPDWIVVKTAPQWDMTFSDAFEITAYECKGFMRDDARKSLLFAAKEYPWIKFVLVWKEEGAWKQQEILK
jgi:hypothetical protein